MRFCEERGMGFVTAAGPVPIVVAFALYDLAEGDGSVRPVTRLRVQSKGQRLARASAGWAVDGTPIVRLRCNKPYPTVTRAAA